ncbi:hypothetical protein B0T10DRAFT_43975 [Thelonectria olida]|uniref:Uncharacterized protein n=1 Tax=Thelonectria olida TaxID=1576542 RepID=A0A9P9ASW5_9HYPO|nr:hypothetical protein B0T10DRAFT_43975 [Thelonectria olida]
MLEASFRPLSSVSRNLLASPPPRVLLIMDITTCPLVPPFAQANALRTMTRTTLPHCFRDCDQLSDPRQNTQDWLAIELQTKKMGKLHEYLWFAGLPRPARPLHRQRLLLRTIYPTESPDEHLVWHDACIFIKPVPEYLLDFDFWQQHLCIHEALHKSACGMLLSYSWLVCHKSDLHIARETGLLPADISWEAWNAFMIDVSRHIDTRTLCQVDRRYGYGELRLSRLNTLYRFGAAGFSIHNAVFGFMTGSTRYTTVFERNFGWILAVFVYISILLSAMQVALATERFNSSIAFQHFSFGIALLSIAFVFSAVAVMLLVWSALFWFHLLSTVQYCKKVAIQRREKACAE